MRTRFHNIDYLSSYHSPSETLGFLNLPIPRLPPLSLPTFEEYLLGFDPDPNISLEIQRLSIEDALSKFITDVTPQKIGVDYGEFEDHQSRNAEGCDDEHWRFSSGTNQIRHFERESEALYEDKENGTTEAYGCEALEVVPLQKDDETTVVDNYARSFKQIQFEAPELHEFLEKACVSEEGMHILSEVSEIENDLDFLRPGLKLQYFDKVQESVEDVSLEYDMDRKAFLLEDDDSGQEQMNFHHNSFPLLEVDDKSLRMFTNLSVEDELLSFLEVLISQQNQNDDLLIDGTELLGSMQYDVFKFLSNHYLSNKCLESELASMYTVLGMDTISLVEKDSADGSLPMSPLVFQEFEFLEADPSQIYEVLFKTQTTDELESCDWMFREDKNFKNFNELIVNCELALTDDTFKSVPIPILLDHDKIRPSHAIVEEILAEQKPQPLSASDGIYLDWHLLEEDRHNIVFFSFCQNILEALDASDSSFDLETFDKGVIDFVLFDDPLNGPKAEEYEESLIVFSDDISNVQLMEAASRELLDNKCSKSGNGEHLAKENSWKATLLFKSMSQFNDLDFFLNPGKVIGEKRENAPGTNSTSPEEGDCDSILPGGKNMDGQRLKEVLNFLPVEDKHNTRTPETADKVEACCMPMDVPFEMKCEQTQHCIMTLPDTIIVVNTQNLDKEMIVSRRSTYQKILAMEKEGLQVVERDLDLPVDIVIISAICLVWYNCINIRRKTAAVDEASSCLPLCIENIATNVLTLLSYTFSCCILIFEGDINFLSTVMESSDGFYAAAASLGVDLQLFCSYSSELTDEIISSNIMYASTVYGGIYPKMSESETLAESFLTRFPSINPLTAHAILSSGGMLIEFLEWSNKQRILAVEQYNVPEESIALFSASCSYGEREDSKSIMTDCSSSVSSGVDSNKGHYNVASEEKPPNSIHSTLKMDIHVDDIWQSELVNQFPDEVQNSSGVMKQDDSWISRNDETLEGLEWPGPSLQDFFQKKQGSDFAQVVDFSTISKPFDLQNSKAPLLFDETKNPRVYLNDKFLGQNERSEMIIKNKLDGNNTSKYGNLHEDLLGEVINLTDSLGKDVPSITKYMDFSTWLPETEEDTTRKPKTARRLSFGKNSHPTFPTAAAINSGSDLWSSVKDQRQGLQHNNSYSDTDMTLKHQKKILGDVLTQTSAGNIKIKEVSFQEDISHYGRTPLSKAIHSAHPQPGSPWTIEFLNRIREKSRLRQQSLSGDISTPEFAYSGNISKATKKRSPSILEFFKYNGGSNPGKIHEQKKQKQYKKLSSSSKSGRTSTCFLPRWTPMDKRSTQTLSFEMNDSGSQTRLVWRDGRANRLSKKLRNQ